MRNLFAMLLLGLFSLLGVPPAQARPAPAYCPSREAVAKPVAAAKPATVLPVQKLHLAKVRALALLPVAVVAKRPAPVPALLTRPAQLPDAPGGRDLDEVMPPPRPDSLRYQRWRSNCPILLRSSAHPLHIDPGRQVG